MMLVEDDLELAVVMMVSMNRLGIRGAVVGADVVGVVAEAWVDAVGTQNRNPNTNVKFGQKSQIGKSSGGAGLYAGNFGGSSGEPGRAPVRSARIPAGRAVRRFGRREFRRAGLCARSDFVTNSKIVSTADLEGK